MSRFCLATAAAIALASVTAAQAPVEPSVTITPPEPVTSGSFGAWVAAIGDADGDALRDLIVAAPTTSVVRYSDGRVYLVSATGDTLSTVDSPNPVYGGQFGRSAAFLGDLTGDNRREAVIGAPFEGPLTGPFDTSDQQGRAYVFAGGSGALLFPLASPDPVPYGGFGISVAGPGDLTGDGTPDIVVGAFYETSGSALYAGNAYVFSGADGTLARTLASPTPTESGAFGLTVHAAGDLTGDGIPDVLVREGRGPSGYGAVHLFSGATGEVVRAFESGSDASAAEFGTAIEVVGDLDADGTPDVAISAPGEGQNGTVRVFSGATAAVLRTFVSATPPQDGRFGAALAPAGDIDGDGVPDVLIGGPYEQGRGGDGARAGRVALFSGATGEELLALTSPSPRLNGAFGVSIDWADIDGDGAPDPVVGAPGERTDTPQGFLFGRVYLYTSTQLRAALGGVVAVETEAPASAFALAAAPNPVISLGAVSLRLAAAQNIRLSVVDALGREVAVLHDGPLTAGTHRLGLDTAGMPAGVYVVRAVGGGQAASQTLTVVR